MNLPAGWMSTAQVAAMVGLDETRVRKYAQAGKLRGWKFGPVWAFREKDVRRFAKQPRLPGRKPLGKRRKKEVLAS